MPKNIFYEILYFTLITNLKLSTTTILILFIVVIIVSVSVSTATNDSNRSTTYADSCLEQEEVEVDVLLRKYERET